MQTYREQLQDKFEAEYNRLNEQQRTAVDTIDGPVMVIAGPGTGKTQILAARIGRILLDTDATPENILCLTYTDAGAIAMRRRLQHFIGADAYRVHIYTFHAFCNDVIQDNLGYFEKTSLDAISELESVQLYKKLIDNFKKDHPLKRYRGDVYFEINNLRTLFSAMKRENWSPEFLNERIDEYIKSLPLRDDYVAKRTVKEFKKGDLRTDKIEEETEKKEKLRAAVNEFENYRAMMREKNRYDFDDMINWVIAAFEQNPRMLQEYQERFQYILVDEYQDTSGTQNKIVELLINYWDSPNVFVVGDDDQSIYRFQGANVENMEAFANRYVDDLRTVVLKNNYRSTQPILDVSMGLINRNDERLVKKIAGLSKDLISSNMRIKDLTHKPRILEFRSLREEMAGITKAVNSLLEAGTAPGDIAVIYKENRFGEELAQYMRIKGIPVFSKRSTDILQHAFIKKIILILRWLDAEHDLPFGGDEYLFEILHLDFYRIPPILIAKLNTEANAESSSQKRRALRELLVEKATRPAKDLFDPGMHSQMKNLSLKLEEIVADVSNLPLQSLVDALIQKAGVLAYLLQHAEKVKLLSLLTGFFDFIKEETARNPSLDLEGLMRTIDLMQEEGIGLPLTQVSGNERSVNLLTVHGSKGLEFGHVFLAGAISGYWEKKRKPGGGYSMPDNLFARDGNSAAASEELRRLFYVGLTRAAEYLTISFSRYRNDGKETEPSVFIAEMREEYDIPVEEQVLSEDELFEFQLLNFTEGKPEIAQPDDDYIDGLLSKFAMSATALNIYLRCPLEFYYKNLVRIPSGKHEALEFGSAVHFALERMFKKMQEDGKEKFRDCEDVLEDFRWYMRRHRENFLKESFARRMEYGETILKDYYHKYVDGWVKIVAIERNIRGVHADGVPLKGKLDKLEFDGKNINVVDYKTGSPENAAAKLMAPNPKNLLGGDYWRQGVFYKILLDNYDQKDWKVVSTEFDFIEPDKKKAFQKRKLVITPEDTDIVRGQIKDSWERIQAKDFFTGCGKEDCHWCGFVKTNDLAVVIHDADDEHEE